MDEPSTQQYYIILGMLKIFKFIFFLKIFFLFFFLFFFEEGKTEFFFSNIFTHAKIY